MSSPPSTMAGQPSPPMTTPASQPNPPTSIPASQPNPQPITPSQNSTSPNTQLNSNLSLPAWPTDLPITKKYINNPAWPASLRLDLEKGNWDEWSHHMHIITQRTGFRHWLNGTYAPPDVASQANQHYTWQLNDDSMRGFILQNILRAECKIIEDLHTSNDMWKVLHTHHEKHGTWHQIMLVKQLLEIQFTIGTPLNETVEKIDDLITRVSNMGDLDWPTFKTYALINALGGEFEYMQSQVHASSNEPGFLANTVVARVLQENDLIKHRAEGGEGSSTLVSQTGRREHECSPLICTHCKRTGHMAEFCISCGGKFAGHSLKEARNAQHAVLTKAQNHIGPSSANITTSKIKDMSRPSSPALSNIPLTVTSNTMPSAVPNTFMINGVTYGPVTPADSANIALLPIQDPNFLFRSFYAEGKPLLHTSIDWNEFSHPMEAYSASQPYGQPNESLSILDSGASCHISLEQGDFIMLNPIALHPITGFGGSCVYATGIGTIKLHTKNGKRMTLNHTLFVPNSTVCLISVFTLNNNGPNACYFDAKSCSIINSSRTIIITGRAWISCHLYILNCT